MKKVKKHYQGMSPHRYKDNPLELAFAVAWQEMNEDSRGGPNDIHSHLAYLMDHRGEPKPPLTDRDRKIAATVFQWLGSPVGKGVLLDLLSSKEAKDWKEAYKDKHGLVG